MRKRITFAFRMPFIPSWGSVYLITTLGDVRAEYIPGSEAPLPPSDAWSYDFDFVDSDIPEGFECDLIIAPYVKPLNGGANDPCWVSIPTVSTVQASHVMGLIPSEGGVCAGMIPLGELNPGPPGPSGPPGDVGLMNQDEILTEGRLVTANPGRFTKFWLDTRHLSALNPEAKYLTVLGSGDSIGTGTGPLPPLLSIWTQRWGVGALVSSSLATWDSLCTQFNSNNGVTVTSGTVVGFGFGGTITATNQPPNFTYFPNGRFWRISSGATTTEIPRDNFRRTGWRKVRCFYGKKTGGGTLVFDLKLDGATISGGTKNADTSIGSGTNDFGWVDFELADGLLRNGALSLVVSGGGTDADYLGSIVYLESGVVPLLWGLGGGTLPNQVTVPEANWGKFITAVNASLVLFAIKGGSEVLIEDRFDLMNAQMPNTPILGLGNFESDVNVSPVPGLDQLLREVIRRKSIEYGTAYMDEWDFLESLAAVTALGENGDDIHLTTNIASVRAGWIDHHLTKISPVGISFNNLEKAALDRPVTWRELDRVLLTHFPHVCSLVTTATNNATANYTLNLADGRQHITWNTSVANPSNFSVLWANPLVIQGHTSWQARFELTEALADVNARVRMVFGANIYPANPLAAFGMAWKLGYDSIAGSGTPWIQFEVHTGSVLHTSPKFYLPVIAGGRGYQMASAKPHRWIVRYDGDGENYGTKRMRCYMAPMTQSSPSSMVEMPELVADWTFTPAGSFFGGATGYGIFGVAAEAVLAAGGSAQLRHIDIGPTLKTDFIGKP